MENDSSRYLVGKAVFTEKSGYRILSVEKPEMKDVWTVDSTDLADNHLDYWGDEVEVLATDVSRWQHQTLMAVFAPDVETLESYISKIKVTYGEKLPEEELCKTVHTQFFSHGVRDEEQQTVSISTRQTIDRHTATLIGDHRTFVRNHGGKLEVNIASQWPLHVRHAISRCTGLEEEEITIRRDRFDVLFDQLCSRPSLSAVLAAAGSLKTGRNIDFSMPTGSQHPQIDFEITTELDTEGNVLYQKQLIHADMGAFPMFPEEYAASLVAGSVPPYEVRALETQVNITSSDNPPANIFSDMGYSMALASLETHYDKVMAVLGHDKAQWRMSHLRTTDARRAVMQVNHSDQAQRATIESCVTLSHFERQNRINLQSGLRRPGISPFINYTRGVAMASGQGTQDFTFNFSYRRDYPVTALLYRDGRVKLGISAESGNRTKTRWAMHFASALSKDSSQIGFLDINSPEVLDMGPDVLERSLVLVQPLLDDLASQINGFVPDGNTQYPVLFTARPELRSDGVMFESNTAACLVLELHIDPVLLVPSIDRVYCHVLYGKVYRRDRIDNLLRQTISQTLREVCPCAKNTYNITIEADVDENVGVGSAKSLIRALTASAFASALSQALDEDIHRLPVHEQDIMGVMRKKVQEKDQEKTDEA